MRYELIRLKTELGMYRLCLYVALDQEEALTMSGHDCCHRTRVISGEQIGTPEDIYNIRAAERIRCRLHR